jgi:hypothetical protein
VLGTALVVDAVGHGGVMKTRTRYRLRLGFEDDFGIISAQVIRIDEVKIERQEHIEWIDTEVPMRHLRIRSGVVLGLLGLMLAGVGLVL